MRLDQADPDVVAQTLGLIRGQYNRYWCPFCQSDGGHHRTPDLSHRPGVGHWKCFRCGWSGTNSGLARALGHDLRRFRQSIVPPPPRKPSKPKTYRTADEAIAAHAERTGARLTQVWRYSDMVVVARFDGNDGKDYRPVRYSATNGGWVIGAPRPPRPLYMRVPDCARSGRTFDWLVVEGEKCVDMAAYLGFRAASSMGGAQSARLADWSALCGKLVLVLPDNDEPGREYASIVSQILGASIAELPGLPDGGDIVDFVQSVGPLEARRYISRL